MELHINGDGDGFEFKLVVRRRSLRSLLIAAGAVLAAPIVTQLGALLGWWYAPVRTERGASKIARGWLVASPDHRKGYAKTPSTTRPPHLYHILTISSVRVRN